MAKMLKLASLVVLSLLVFHVGADTPGNFQSDDNLGTVVLASVIYRHGDRTPIDPYPEDPYRNLSYWPTGWGQLTNIGKEQHYELGKWLRARYAELLPEIYSKDDILVRSTDVDRTLMSAASNLAGLYEPKGKQVWNTNIDWQPIPIHTLPETMDDILAGKKKCPRYDYELKKVKESEAMQELNRHYSDLFAYLSAYSGKEVRDIQGVEFIYNTLYIERLYNLTLPQWTLSIFPKKMIVPAAKSFTVPAYNEELQRLKCGPLLGEIVGHMTKKSTGKLSPDRKMFMYSGHDTTIANMLMTLGVFKAHNPAYTAAILIELRKDLAKNYTVTVWYRNASSADPMLLTIPGCSQPCPLSSFINVTKHLVPIDWERECHTSFAIEDFCSRMGVPEVAVMVILGLLMVTMVLLVFLYCRKHATSYVYQRLPTGVDVA